MELDKIFLSEMAKINNNIEKVNRNLDKYTEENIRLNVESKPVFNSLEEDNVLSLSNELRILVKEKLKKRLLVEFISKYSINGVQTDISLDNSIKQFETLYGNAPFDEDDDEDKDMIVIFGQNFILDYVIRKSIEEQKQIYFNAILESLKRQGFTREQINEGLISLSGQLYNIENGTINVK